MKGLAKNARADQLTVGNDELTVGLVLEQQLSKTGYDEWVDETENDGGGDGIEERGDDVTAHREAFMPDEWRR